MKAHYRMVCLVIIVFLLMTGNVLGAQMVFPSYN